MGKALTRPFTAHTITQRLRSLKKIPPELVPLGVVIAYVFIPGNGFRVGQMTDALYSFAVFAAAFAMARKLFTDKTLRLSPTRGGH
jgi:hypothetical protein